MKSIAAIVLGAGESRRLGQPKQLVVFEGESLLDRSVRSAREAGLAPVMVVLGANAALIRSRCALAEAQVIENLGWRDGLAAAIRAGAGALLSTGVEGVVVMTCDQPAVCAGHLRLLTAHLQRATASFYAGRRGIPAYFPRRLFSELLRLSGDAGAREMLVAADAIELPGGEFDIDTPAALLALQNQSEQVGPG